MQICKLLISGPLVVIENQKTGRSCREGEALQSNWRSCTELLAMKTGMSRYALQDGK